MEGERVRRMWQVGTAITAGIFLWIGLGMTAQAWMLGCALAMALISIAWSSLA